MNVTCPGCQRSYNIPDEKIPATGTAYVTCPQCQQRFPVQARPAAAPPPPGPSATTAPAAPEPGGGEEDLQEYFPPGTQTALIHCTEYDARTQIEKSLTEMGYEVRTVRKERELAVRLRYHVYDVLVVYQGGAEATDDSRAILRFVHQLPMDVRREMFLVLVHLGGNKHDTLKSFLLSVDLNITPLDLSDFAHLLKQGLEQKHARYKAFLDSRAMVDSELF
ncbi:hypothetical protein G3N55_02735 [Dissulfurirhabdus thermomarina]|uniref:Zinc finger/thioredoxin putative domain-containing protein n=1 Tax=Dissulfurirhabdus thermomarina TaxID=1765737 RepID=A0A6N9TKX1_DISTH|nr:zinc-ribbon domain-containing protein [Dissulfurirhabdus thermomarina]NDY41769.1 hypothetical protein [Dissulfurirhabdus thermomarina]NMX24020.1 hypothetical protein [Dissulfurirhabdus thermomarina]